MLAYIFKRSKEGSHVSTGSTLFPVRRGNRATHSCLWNSSNKFQGAREKGYKGLIIPTANAHEAAVVNNLDVIAADNLVDVVQFLNGEKDIEPTVIDTRAEFFASVDKFDVDFDEVKGQESVKRALEVYNTKVA